MVLQKQVKHQKQFSNLELIIQLKQFVKIEPKKAEPLKPI
jgi:hypothetical protein